MQADGQTYKQLEIEEWKKMKGKGKTSRKRERDGREQIRVESEKR